jgi:hypothetical protein
LSPFVPLSLRPSVLNSLSLFAPLRPCVESFLLSLRLRAASTQVDCVESFCLLSSCSRCLRAASSKEDGGSNFAFSAPASRVPAVQMAKWARGGCSRVPAVWCQSSANVPCSRRRKVAVLRHTPVFPPFTPAANWQNGQIIRPPVPRSPARVPPPALFSPAPAAPAHRAARSRGFPSSSLPG